MIDLKKMDKLFEELRKNIDVLLEERGDEIQDELDDLRKASNPPTFKVVNYAINRYSNPDFIELIEPDDFIETKLGISTHDAAIRTLDILGIPKELIENKNKLGNKQLKCDKKGNRCIDFTMDVYCCCRVCGQDLSTLD
jgi:hypothetical protein